jgi:hypothetical protein
MERSTKERQFIMASSTTFLFSLQVLPSTNFPGPFPPLIPPGGTPFCGSTARLQAPYSLLRFPPTLYQKPKKCQPRSDTGYQSRGSSSIPAGHIQISFKDKKECIKWVKFGLKHKHRMKAASELQKRRNQNRASPLTMTCPTRNCQACGTLNLRLTPD